MYKLVLQSDCCANGSTCIFFYCCTISRFNFCMLIFLLKLFPSSFSHSSVLAWSNGKAWKKNTNYFTTTKFSHALNYFFSNFLSIFAQFRTSYEDHSNRRVYVRNSAIRIKVLWIWRRHSCIMAELLFYFFYLTSSIHMIEVVEVNFVNPHITPHSHRVNVLRWRMVVEFAYVCSVDVDLN